MRFSDYFESWLHQNYYKKGVKIGKNGDFYTAVSVGAFFGICIAKEILRIYKNSKIYKFEKIDIVEIGANEGHLICDIIQGLYTFDSEIFKFFKFNIIEPHEALQKIQKEKIYERFGDEVEVRHISDIKNIKFKNTIFISNELFDSFKCEIINNGKILFITQNGKLEFKKITDEKILNLTSKFQIKKGELPISYYEFANLISQSCENFEFITFDYGYMHSLNEYSLRIYQNHQVFNFFEVENLDDFFGKSDITYNVNFEILKDSFECCGAQMSEFKKQKQALVDFGATEILEMFLQNKSKNGYNNALLEFKHLFNEFDEKFKMIKFKKGIL